MTPTGLTIAVPPGALFGPSLALPAPPAPDTQPIRENDRRLIFPELGVITTRPSDVPTYVEHGAADLGITGKDVLLEQADPGVAGLLDLRYGFCRRIGAARDGDAPLGEPLRRRG